MKRFIVALSTLAPLLVAAPASAAHDSQALDLCEPPNAPEQYIFFLTQNIMSETYRGPLCLKACKGEIAGCKKVSTSTRKCKDVATKATFKTGALKCQLEGMPKKMCIDDSKTSLKGLRDLWKSEFLGDMGFCKLRGEECKAACAP